MNILFLTRLYFPHIGGVERHVEEIGKRLIVKGKGVTVVTTKYAKEFSSAWKWSMRAIVLTEFGIIWSSF